MNATTAPTAHDLAVVASPRSAPDDLRVEPASLTVSVETMLTGADADAAWETYRESLAPLSSVATPWSARSPAEGGNNIGASPPFAATSKTPARTVRWRRAHRLPTRACANWMN